MNTKAASMILWIFEIIVVIFIISITVQVATSFSKGQVVQKINTAQDLTMMINTFVGIPGDAVVEYPKNVAGQKFILSSDNIIVFSPGDTELQRITRTLNLPDGYRADGFVDNKEHLCLTKSGTRIILEDCS